MEYWGTEVTLSADNPLLAGADPSVWLADADVILVVDSQAPWMIRRGRLSPGLHRDPDGGPIRSSPATRCAAIARGHQPGGRDRWKSSACWKRRAPRLPQAARQQHVAERAAYTQSRIQQQKTSATRFSMPARPGPLPNPGSATAPAIWLINTAAGSFLN
ncbi:hypothetical protein LNP74_05570 [Klebsiella pneumoniae subsp. pneumoniae]|nr:hypothetical protein [Klebsiella pneumoniae subsp. pneumoniae]